MAIEFEGVQNRVAIPQIIANESLYRLSMNVIFPRISNRTYQHYFDSSIGDTVTVKRPFKARSQTGRIMNTKAALIDKTVEISIDKRHHFAIEAVDEDMTLRIEDYGERYLEVGAEELAYDYDTAGGKELSETFFFHEGGDNTALDKSRGQLVTAHASKVAIPRKRRFAVLDPYEFAAISTDVMEVDAPEMVTGAIRDMYKGKYAGWSLLESNFISPMDCQAMASGAAPRIAGSDAASLVGSSINTDGWGRNNATVLNKGQLIQIANVYEVQPRGDRRSTGKLQTFVVTEDARSNGAGAATVKVYPEIITASGLGSTIANPGSDVDGNKDFDGGNDVQDLDMGAFQTVTAAPVNNAVITVVGQTANQPAKSYRQALFMCGDALEYINVKLKTPKSAFMSGSQVDDETGLAITYTSDWDQTQYTEVDRMDILFGVKNIYPELGIRYISAQVGS